MFDPIMTQKLLEPSTHKALSPNSTPQSRESQTVKHDSQLLNSKIRGSSSHWDTPQFILSAHLSQSKPCAPKTVLHSLVICNRDQDCDGHCHGCNGLGGGPG